MERNLDDPEQQVVDEGRDSEFSPANIGKRIAVRRIGSYRSAKTEEARRRELAAAGGTQNHGLTFNYSTGKKVASELLKSILRI